MKALLLAAILLPLAVLRATELDYAVVPSGTATAEIASSVERPSFGLTFVAEPKARFTPPAIQPKVLAKAKTGGFVRAVLRVTAEGRVAEVKIVEANPGEGLERVAEVFFNRMIFWPNEGDGAKSGEFETDLTLVFRQKAAAEMAPAAPSP